MTKSDAIGFWAWLLYPSTTLVALGIHPRDVVPLRFEATGHQRPVPVEWAEACFSWGGVETSGEIALKTGHTKAQVQQHAHDAGLRFATQKRRRTHAELALMLWCDRGRSPRESCKRFGVPAGARRVLCAAMQELVDKTNGDVKEVLEWPVTRLEFEFAALRLDLQPPPSILAAVRAVARPRGRAA
jgi:hypothetical protein